MKNRLFILLTTLFMTVCAYGVAAATLFTFEAGTSSVDTSGTHDGLVMYDHVNTDLGNERFSLNPSESNSFLFAALGTEETWINKDDLNPGSIKVSDVSHSIGFWQGSAGSAYIYATNTLHASPVPEPATMFLLGVGLITMAGFARRRRSGKK